MSYDFEQKYSLLALANKPDDAASISQWHPFRGGAALGEMIAAFNERSVVRFEADHWLADWIERFVWVIQVKERDLSTVNRLRIKDFKDINFLLVDIDVVDTESDLFRNLHTKMAAATETVRDRPYYLPQVSQRADSVSKSEAFKPLPVMRSRPDILRSQAEFDAYLDGLRGEFASPLVAMPAPDDTIDARAVDKYVRAIPDLARKVQETAALEDLSQDQVAQLAESTGKTELFLREFETTLAESVGKREIALDAIRMSVPQISQEILRGTPQIEFEDTDLVRLEVKSPLADFSEIQVNILGDLGVRNRRTSAVHFADAGIEQQLDALSGKIEVEHFTAKLPHFSARGGGDITDPSGSGPILL